MNYYNLPRLFTIIKSWIVRTSHVQGHGQGGVSSMCCHSDRTPPKNRLGAQAFSEATEMAKPTVAHSESLKHFEWGNQMKVSWKTYVRNLCGYVAINFLINIKTLYKQNGYWLKMMIPFAANWSWSLVLNVPKLLFTHEKKNKHPDIYIYIYRWCNVMQCKVM